MAGPRPITTLVVMEVSESVFFLIRAQLKDAGYDHAIVNEGGRHELLDMSGFALVERPTPTETPVG